MRAAMSVLQIAGQGTRFRHHIPRTTSRRQHCSELGIWVCLCKGTLFRVSRRFLQRRHLVRRMRSTRSEGDTLCVIWFVLSVISAAAHTRGHFRQSASLMCVMHCPFEQRTDNRSRLQS